MMLQIVFLKFLEALIIEMPAPQIFSAAYARFIVHCHIKHLAVFVETCIICQEVIFMMVSAQRSSLHGLD